MSMRKIYRKIAREHGVSPKEVREEMQAAIMQAYQNPPDDNITEIGRASCRERV